MCKISIICPAYNVGPYIDKFLNSLKSQTYQNYELIFVYDKSNDDTLIKIEDFAKQEKYKNRTKIIINKEKKGTGFAKDLGFKNSDPSSQFLLFLDADDCFDNDYFETLVKKAEETNADITCCGFSRINSEGGSLICKEMVNNPKEIVKIENCSFPLFLINTSAWNKLYRREIANKCSFSTVEHAEDLYYLLEAFANSKTISFINESKYSYLIHSGSLIDALTYEKYQNTCSYFLNYTKFKNNKKLFDLISAFIFLRIGIGTTIRVCQSKEKKNRLVVKESKLYLKNNFNVFKRNRYLSFLFLAKSGLKGVAIWILKVMYKLGIFNTAVNLYIYKTKRSKKEIRW